MKLGLGELFSDLLIQPNGIQTILRVVSDLTAESSQNFCQRGLEEWSNLIHNYYTKSKTKYTNFIVPQVNLIKIVFIIFSYSNIKFTLKKYKDKLVDFKMFLFEN